MLAAPGGSFAWRLPAQQQLPACLSTARSIWIVTSFISESLVRATGTDSSPKVPPFLLTYLATSLFILYLPFVHAKRWLFPLEGQGSSSATKPTQQRRCARPSAAGTRQHAASHLAHNSTTPALLATRRYAAVPTSDGAGVATFSSGNPLSPPAAEAPGHVQHRAAHAAAAETHHNGGTSAAALGAGKEGGKEGGGGEDADEQQAMAAAFWVGAGWLLGGALLRHATVGTCGRGHRARCSRAAARCDAWGVRRRQQQDTSASCLPPLRAAHRWAASLHPQHLRTPALCATCRQTRPATHSSGPAEASNRRNPTNTHAPHVPWVHHVQTTPLWFLAQWTFNLSLALTSVTSNTILSSTSSLFTFGLSVLLLGERFTLKKLACIVACMLGTALVTLSDLKASEDAAAAAAAAARLPPAPALAGGRHLLGLAWAGVAGGGGGGRGADDVAWVRAAERWAGEVERGGAGRWRLAGEARRQQQDGGGGGPGDAGGESAWAWVWRALLQAEPEGGRWGGGGGPRRRAGFSALRFFGAVAGKQRWRAAESGVVVEVLSGDGRGGKQVEPMAVSAASGGSGGGGAVLSMAGRWSGSAEAAGRRGRVALQAAAPPPPPPGPSGGQGGSGGVLAPVVGDLLVLASGAFYAAYTVVMRLKLPGEEAGHQVASFFG